MNPRSISTGGREFAPARVFVAPASRRLFCFAVEFVAAAFRRASLNLLAFDFVAAGPATRDRAAVAVGASL
jgi:hypothetical protein